MLPRKKQKVFISLFVTLILFQLYKRMIYGIDRKKRDNEKLAKKATMATKK
jgi:hypothetical protein